ncbi:MAG: NADPH-dependent assimilatory sulfite reductase hemoprotein subunit [Holophaga sp.]|nr:NADPH-dependent assimilatory sulfite reductase hemoprotein subunit [Holophaga sp.]
MTESTMETLKRASRQLRGTLAEETAAAEPGYGKDSEQLLKAHGLYQQKDRDRRGENPPPTLMLRGRTPGGRLEPDQYLAWDRLADQFGDGTLRITTRQSIELHGVRKHDVKRTLQDLQQALLTTKGACGDLVRNVTLAPNPWQRPDLSQLEPVADLLSSHFLPRSRAYAEIWLDGEKVPGPEVEPIYGATYLPRKFKIALTAAGENLVDLYTNDLAFAATFADGRLEGCFVFAGGGMGMTHNDPTTFPRLADLLGWIPASGVLAVAEALVTILRDHGNREDRRHARLKYLAAARGIPWLKAELERRSGVPFSDRELPPWNTPGVLGWLPRADGTWAHGVHTLSGRIAGPLKQALASVVAAHRLPVQLSPDQDLILLGIPDGQRAAVASALHLGGALEADPLARRALACVALPLCGLAITEAERALPDLLAPLRAALLRHGLLERAPVFRVTGCANGCARPYSAELALVGQAVGKYAVWAGGSPQGDRLAFELRQKVSVDDLPVLFDRLVAAWAAEGEPGEPFGAFARRLGPEALEQRLTVR